MRDDILKRIQTASPSFKKVGVVADISALLDGAASLQILPGAFLYLVGESAETAQDRPGGFTQMVTYRWGVMIVTRSRNDAEGDAAASQTDELVAELDDCLLGWSPDEAQTSMRKSRNAGQLRRWAKDLYFYSANYEVDKRICK